MIKNYVKSLNYNLFFVVIEKFNNFNIFVSIIFHYINNNFKSDITSIYIKLIICFYFNILFTKQII